VGNVDPVFSSPWCTHAPPWHPPICIHTLLFKHSMYDGCSISRGWIIERIDRYLYVQIRICIYNIYGYIYTCLYIWIIYTWIFTDV
jgi:hypothetical protein